MSGDPARLRDRRVQYETAGLDVVDVDADPIVQWQRWYDDAFEAGVAEPNAMTVATVDADGAPDARIVLVRGADELGFTFFTNYAVRQERASSPPVRQRRRRSAGSTCIVRFGCAAPSATSTTPRATSTSRRALAAARSARGPRPSRNRSPTARALDARIADVAARFDGVDVPRPPHWGGWRITPTEWEFWQGRPSRLHDRLRYVPADGSAGWRIERLAP